MKPLAGKVALVRYVRPGSTGGIIIPGSARMDNTLSLWNVVAVGKDCDGISPDNLVYVRPWKAIYGGIWSGKEVFFVRADEVELIVGD